MGERKVWRTERRCAALRFALSLLLSAYIGAAAGADGAPASGAAGAEVQINLCTEPAEIVRALALHAESATPREAWYFDTPDLALFRRGLVFRLRLTGRGAELTLKAADQDCKQVPPALLPAREGKCEYDLHGSDFKGAVSLTRRLDEATSSALLGDRIPLEKALSAAQVRFLREGASAWPLPPGIARLGPVRIHAFHSKTAKFVVEAWALPAGTRYVEISEKARVDDALRRRSELENVLAGAGVKVCADQASQAGAKLRELAGRR
jgi:hypothetical protein